MPTETIKPKQKRDKHPRPCKCGGAPFVFKCGDWVCERCDSLERVPATHSMLNAGRLALSAKGRGMN